MALTAFCVFHLYGDDGTDGEPGDEVSFGEVAME